MLRRVNIVSSTILAKGNQLISHQYHIHIHPITMWTSRLMRLIKLVHIQTHIVVHQRVPCTRSVTQRHNGLMVCPPCCPLAWPLTFPSSNVKDVFYSYLLLYYWPHEPNSRHLFPHQITICLLPCVPISNHHPLSSVHCTATHRRKLL